MTLLVRGHILQILQKQLVNSRFKLFVIAYCNATMKDFLAILMNKSMKGISLVTSCTPIGIDCLDNILPAHW